MANKGTDLSRWSKFDAVGESDEPGPVRPVLAAANDPVLQTIAQETRLSADLILMCARALSLNEEQIGLLPEAQQTQTRDMLHDPRFGAVRHAAQKYQEATFTVKVRPDPKKEQKLPDPEKVLRNVELALNMSDAQIGALPEQQRAAVRAMREDPMFESARGQVRAKQDSLKRAARNPPEVVGPKPSLSGMSPGSTPSVMKQCAQALSLTEDQVQGLPEQHQVMLKAIRNAPEFGYLRGALMKAANSSEDVEERLQAAARELGADAEGVRAVAQAMRLSDEEITMLPEPEKVSILRIRNDVAFAEVREAIQKLGLNTILSAEEKVAFKALLQTSAGEAEEVQHIDGRGGSLAVAAAADGKDHRAAAEAPARPPQADAATKQAEEEARRLFEEAAAQQFEEMEAKKKAEKAAKRKQYEEMMRRLKEEAQTRPTDVGSEIWDMMGQAATAVEHGSGEEARQLMQGALKAAQEVQSQEKELSEEEQEKQHMDSITKFIATKKILGALKYAEDTATQNPEEALNAMNHLMEAFQSAQRDLHQAEQRELESAKAPLPEPQYTIADQADRLVLKATLPELGNMENVVLDGTQDHFSLHAAPHYSLELDLPCSINEDAVQAKFSRKSHVLTVTMPKL